MKAKLLENEQLVKERSANYFNRGNGLLLGQSAGGKLYLTNQRLLFEGHGFNVGRELVVVYLKDIISCSTGFPNTLTLLSDRNEEFKFAVNGKKDWQNKINKHL